MEAESSQSSSVLCSTHFTPPSSGGHNLDLENLMNIFRTLEEPPPHTHTRSEDPHRRERKFTQTLTSFVPVAPCLAL